MIYLHNIQVRSTHGVLVMLKDILILFYIFILLKQKYSLFYFNYLKPHTQLLLPRNMKKHRKWILLNLLNIF